MRSLPRDFGDRRLSKLSAAAELGQEFLWAKALGCGRDILSRRKDVPAPGHERRLPRRALARATALLAVSSRALIDG